MKKAIVFNLIFLHLMSMAPGPVLEPTQAKRSQLNMPMNALKVTEGVQEEMEIGEDAGVLDYLERAFHGLEELGYEVNENFRKKYFGDAESGLVSFARNEWWKNKSEYADPEMRREAFALRSFTDPQDTPFRFEEEDSRRLEFILATLQEKHSIVVNPKKVELVSAESFFRFLAKNLHPNQEKQTLPRYQSVDYMYAVLGHLEEFGVYSDHALEHFLVPKELASIADALIVRHAAWRQFATHYGEQKKGTESESERAEAFRYGYEEQEMLFLLVLLMKGDPVEQLEQITFEGMSDNHFRQLGRIYEKTIDVLYSQEVKTVRIILDLLRNALMKAEKAQEASFLTESAEQEISPFQKVLFEELQGERSVWKELKWPSLVALLDEVIAILKWEYFDDKIGDRLMMLIGTIKAATNIEIKKFQSPYYLKHRIFNAYGVMDLITNDLKEAQEKTMKQKKLHKEILNGSSELRRFLDEATIIDYELSKLDNLAERLKEAQKEQSEGFKNQNYHTIVSSIQEELNLLIAIIALPKESFRYVSEKVNFEHDYSELSRKTDLKDPKEPMKQIIYIYEAKVVALRSQVLLIAKRLEENFNQYGWYSSKFFEKNFRVRKGSQEEGQIPISVSELWGHFSKLFSHLGTARTYQYQEDYFGKKTSFLEESNLSPQEQLDGIKSYLFHWQEIYQSPFILAKFLGFLLDSQLNGKIPDWEYSEELYKLNILVFLLQTCQGTSFLLKPLERRISILATSLLLGAIQELCASCYVDLEVKQVWLIPELMRHMALLETDYSRVHEHSVEKQKKIEQKYSEQFKVLAEMDSFFGPDPFEELKEVKEAEEEKAAKRYDFLSKLDLYEKVQVLEIIRILKVKDERILSFLRGLQRDPLLKSNVQELLKELELKKLSDWKFEKWLAEVEALPLLEVEKVMAYYDYRRLPEKQNWRFLENLYPFQEEEVPVVEMEEVSKGYQLKTRRLSPYSVESVFFMPVAMKSYFESDDVKQRLLGFREIEQITEIPHIHITEIDRVKEDRKEIWLLDHLKDISDEMKSVPVRFSLLKFIKALIAARNNLRDVKTVDFNLENLLEEVLDSLIKRNHYENPGALQAYYFELVFDVLEEPFVDRKLKDKFLKEVFKVLRKNEQKPEAWLVQFSIIQGFRKLGVIYLTKKNLLSRAQRDLEKMLGSYSPYVVSAAVEALLDLGLMKHDVGMQGLAKRNLERISLGANQHELYYLARAKDYFLKKVPSLALGSLYSMLHRISDTIPVTFQSLELELDETISQAGILVLLASEAAQHTYDLTDQELDIDLLLPGQTSFDDPCELHFKSA